MKALLLTLLLVLAPAHAAVAAKDALVAPQHLAAAEADVPKAKPAAAKPPTVKLYDQRMELDDKGAGRVRARIEVIGMHEGPLDLPLAAWGDIGDFQLDRAPPGFKATPVTKGANARLSVIVPPDTPAAFTIETSFTTVPPKAAPSKGADEVQAKYQTIGHRIMNGTPIAVERYRLEVVFPEGTVAHQTLEAAPKAKAKETTPRVQLVGSDGRQGAVLQISDLKFGDSASMRLEYGPEQKPWTLLWIGLALSIAYLVFFRDVLSTPAGSTRADHTHKAHE